MDFKDVKQPFGWMKTISDVAGALTRLGFLALLFNYIYTGREAINRGHGTSDTLVDIVWVSSLTMVAGIFILLAASLYFVAFEVAMSFTKAIAGRIHNKLLEKVVAIVLVAASLIFILSFVLVVIFVVNQSTGFITVPKLSDA